MKLPMYTTGEPDPMQDKSLLGGDSSDNGSLPTSGARNATSAVEQPKKMWPGELPCVLAGMTLAASHLPRAARSSPAQDASREPLPPRTQGQSVYRAECAFLVQVTLS